jgi:multidrug efflux pump subunit AcrA (membrane-fusion protein)
MTAKAKIEVDRREAVLRVPIQAVTTRERKKLDEEMKEAGKGAGSAAKAAAAPAGKGPASASTKGGDAQVRGPATSTSRARAGVGGGAGRDEKAAPASEKSGEKQKTAENKTMDGDRDELEVIYVVDGNKVHAVPVKTGVSDETYVEIKEGAKEGESVVKGPYRVLRRLKVGDRVVKKDESEMNEAAAKAAESSGNDSD